MSTEQFGHETESSKHVKWTDERPSRASGSTSTLSLFGLQKRLTEAESNTKRLVERLAELGFSSEVRTNAELSQHHQQEEPVKPFRAASDTVQSVQIKLTEIANRLGANETSLDTLQKTVEQIQLQQAAILQHNDKSVKKVLSDESKRLSRDLAKSRRELREMKECQQDSRDVVLKLTSALDIATSNKMAILARMEEMKGAKQKTMNRMSEVKAKLAHETARRIELEESQLALLSQVKEMDHVVDVARGEVRSLSQDCTVLRKEVIRVREELGKEQQKRLNVGKKMKELTDELASKDSNIAMLAEEHKTQSVQLGDTRKKLKRVQDECSHSQNNLQKSDGELEAAKNCIVKLQEQLSACQSEKDRLTDLHQDSVQKEQENSQTALKQKQREEELERIIADIQEKNGELFEKLSQAENERGEAAQSLQEVCKHISLEREQFSESIAQKEQVVVGLREQLSVALAEKQEIMADKEKLLEEINQAVDSMSAERQMVSLQLQDLQSRLADSDSAKTKLQEELNGLRLERSSVQSQLMDLSKLENMKAELKAVELARDRSNRELQRLQTRLKKLEAQKTESTTQIVQMGRSLTLCHEDNTQLVESLETVTASNQELQEILESVRAQLEKKARQVKALSEARGTWEVTIHQLQSEVNHLQAQLVAMERSLSSADASLVVRLETAVAHYQTENSRLLESAAHARANLKDCTVQNQNLERCLGETKELCKQAAEERDRLQQDVLKMRKQLNSSDFRYSSLQKTNSKLTKQLEHLNSQYNTVEAVNHQLENQVSTAEKQISKLNRGVLALKGQLSNARRSQDKAEKQLRVTKLQGSETKSTNEDPSKLRRDLNLLAGAHLNSEQLIRRQKDELEHTKTAKAIVEQQYEDLVTKKDKELMELKTTAGQQIADAAERASRASAQLEEAEETYKTTVNQLKTELGSARRCQASLKLKTSMQREELERVRGKAQEQTRKAQQAIQSCRLTVGRLASQTEIDQTSAGESLARIHSQWQLERDMASSSAQKYEQLKVSSAKRCRELAEEVAHLKSLHSPVDGDTRCNASTN